MKTRTTQPVRPKLDDVLRVAVSPDEKRALFEAAAREHRTVSEMVREVVATSILRTQQAA